MNPQERQLVRSIVRRVHPDLFAAHPQERAQNSESLKALNNYVDSSAKRQVQQSVPISFWVREDDSFVKIEAELPSHGSLGPLFYAFGLITDEELRQGYGSYDAVEDHRNFLQWLSTTVQEAVQTADEHERLKGVIRELKAGIEDRFALAAVQVGGEFAISTAEQQRQIESLQVLDACLTTMTVEAPRMFEGLSMRLYHPLSAHSDTFSHLDRNEGAPAESFIADDGCLHVVAERSQIQTALGSLDLAKARLLTRLCLFWVRRVKELTPALAQLLGVENVWCDTRTESSSQQFVLWAGCVLETKRDFQEALKERHFAFSVLVHADNTSPLIDFLASSSVLQVRADCMPRKLLEYMCSKAGLAASDAAAAGERSKAQEDLLLEQVREALGCKHVIRVCTNHDQGRVMEAAERLLQHAAAIRCSVDLSGASIAIDDCYELWESGFISIPYNFNLKDLQPQLQRLLGTASSASSTSAKASSFSGTELEGSDASYQPGKEAGNGLVVEAPARDARRHKNGNNVVASCSWQRHSCFGWQAAGQRLHTTLSAPTCSTQFWLASHPVRPQHPHLLAANSRCKHFNVNFRL